MSIQFIPMEEGLHREHFPDGTLSAEYTIKNGEPNGRFRRWHENGVLSEERHYRNGRLHGVAKQWNAHGTLLGVSKLQNGTGLLQEWHGNGQLAAEYSYSEGELNGRMRVWGEDGMLYVERYFFHDRPISKKRYLEQCKRNRRLPRFPEERIKNTLGNYVRRLRREKREQAKHGPTPEQIEGLKEFDDQCRLETKERQSKELLSWLRKSARRSTELSELSRGEALRLARRLYALGATKVWATRIERDPDGVEYSIRLIIALPESANCRRKIFQECSDPARPFGNGSGPAIVIGHNYMSISLM